MNKFNIFSWFPEILSWFPEIFSILYSGIILLSRYTLKAGGPKFHIQTISQHKAVEFF